MAGWFRLYAITSASESGASPTLVPSASADCGNFCSRSLRMLELLNDSARMMPTFRVAAEASVPAAPASASSPDSPVASRPGSTIAGRTFLSVASFLARSFNPGVRVGQPSADADGSGTASTIGLSATEPSGVGVNPGASAAIRSSQVLESGIHTSTSAETLFPTAVTPRLTPCLVPTTAAIAVGSAELTSTVTQSPSTLASRLQLAAAAVTAGATAGAAATFRLWVVAQFLPASAR
jgi:hypothetical protein